MPDRWKGILEEQGNSSYPSWYEVDDGSPKVNGYEEIPSPPSGAKRWAEFEADAPVMEASTPYSLPVGLKPAIKELARRVGSGIAYGKDRAKQAINYGIDALAGGNGYSGYESTEGINELVPANTQNWWAYDTKRQDFQSDKNMPYTSYVYGSAVDPSKEYANFTDTDVYRLVNADDAKVGGFGRAMGNVLNRLGGNFESTPDDDEMTWRKALATAQGVQGYLADTLPEQLEALGTEYGIRGLATLSPWFGDVLTGKNHRENQFGSQQLRDYRNTGKIPGQNIPAMYKDANGNVKGVSNMELATNKNAPSGWVDQRSREEKIYDYFYKHPSQAERYRERLNATTEDGGAVARAINDKFTADWSKAENIKDKAAKMARAMDGAYGGSSASPFDAYAIEKASNGTYDPIFNNIYKDVETGLFNDEELVWRALMRNPSRYNNLNKQALVQRMYNGFGNPYQFKKANDDLDIARAILEQGKSGKLDKDNAKQMFNDMVDRLLENY